MTDPTAPHAAPDVDKPVPRMVGHLHAFRAITIVMIVAVHVSAITLFFNYDFANGGTAITLIGVINESLLHNSTIFFALISGILFARILEARGWKRFFRCKALNVVAPYAVVTILYAFFALDVINGGYIKVFSGSLPEFPKLVFADFFHLKVQSNPIFWYIPVLLILFAATPVIVAILRSAAAPIAIAVILFIPLVVSRTWPDFSWNNVVFFLAPYAAGIYFGVPGRYEWTLDFFRRWKWPAIAVVIASSVSVWFITRDLEPLMWGPVNPFETVTYIQKMIAAPLLLLWLHRFDDGMPRALSRLADDSFAIYFLHIWPVVGMLWIIDHTIGANSSPFLFEALVVIGTAAILAMLLVIIGTLRRILGKWSRPIIGA